jgi:hypothetical protein
MRLVVAAEGTTGPAEPSLIEAKRTLLLPRGVSFDAVAAAERQLGVGEARARVMEVRLPTEFVRIGFTVIRVGFRSSRRDCAREAVVESASYRRQACGRVSTQRAQPAASRKERRPAPRSESMSGHAELTAH